MKHSDLHEPLLSIIIVTFNASQFLPRTLNSLMSQKVINNNDVEVVVVDGGSTDGTLELVKKSSLVSHFISERDDGIYDAMNKGAQLATGRWLHFLNAGDSFTDPECLRLLLLGLESADRFRVPWAISGARNLGGDKGLVRRIPSLPHIWWRHAYGLQPHCHQATWFKRTTFLDSGAHSLRFQTADDFDVIVRFGMLARPFVIEQVLIDYLGGGISELTSALIPSLQHQVRAERFQLGPLGRLLDKQVGRALSSVTRARIVAGRIKSKI
ncbi:glycosyltransferase [Pseudarthrobacter sp. NIBRBAC000502772]|uniref:glycosyltransferase n=1 Tax=Pseudarthrobacter sp. NIBRBAC000502772 TaxID=2590775 RepID=UPI0011311AF9|nr:glycosyltransferase [Pseudarthrobacter sp. NIBRBAC000502772]QDG68081.1 glycosyltransferase [Pseudarthrobacter sp. NIBRBAC000502772]